MLALVALAVCTPCHAAIVESYAKTGMARSFYALTKATAIEDFTRANVVTHKPSESRFTVFERDGRYYMRRDHARAGMIEKEIHYVLGSGNHARSYVHRTPQGRLLALPISWYASPQGGYWQMAPGFDRPDHVHFRRRIGYDCFFCHNSYPKIPDTADPVDAMYLEPLPQGIDCSRCHGPVEEHLRKPGKGTILNPRGLTANRQLEVCLQCHLETTSQPLPFGMRRFGRQYFSYNPRQPLGDYMIHFDHEDRAPWNEKFEVVSAPYRMMQSACFRKSNGRMTCTTCHNPHERPTSADTACRNCHEKVHRGKPEAAQNCITCHMAKRSPEDARLTTFTDHRIAIRPDKRPGQDLPEYTGKVRIYWPPGDDGGVYRDIVNKPDPKRPLPREAEAILVIANKVGAAGLYEAVTQADPKLLGGWRGLAHARFPDLRPIEQGLVRFPLDPFLMTHLGEALRARGRLADSERASRAAIMADPDQADPYINLGVLLAQQGRVGEAIRLFQQAWAIDPLSKAAESNLKLVLGPRQ